MARYRKAITAAIAAATTAVTQGLIDGDAAKFVAVGVAVAAVFGVYAVANEPQD